MNDLESAVAQLQEVPLEDFVAERKRLAKELRDEGERGAAAELAKLPKPSAPAWALNHVAREQPELAGEWLAAVDALRDASTQADRASGVALRAAMTAHRDATRRLLASVRDDARPNGRKLTEPMLDRVRELLQDATADPDRAEQLRAARVVEGDAPAAASDGVSTDTARREAASDSKATAGERAAEEPATRARAAEERATTKRTQHEAAKRAELERLVDEAEVRVSALREAAAETEVAAVQAEERLEQATRTLLRSESEADAARQAAADAAQATKQGERELEKLAAKLSS